MISSNGMKSWSTSAANIARVENAVSRSAGCKRTVLQSQLTIQVPCFNRNGISSGSLEVRDAQTSDLYWQS